MGKRFEVLDNGKNFITIQDNLNGDDFITEDNIEDILNEQNDKIAKIKQQPQEIVEKIRSKLFANAFLFEGQDEPYGKLFNIGVVPLYAVHRVLDEILHEYGIKPTVERYKSVIFDRKRFDELPKDLFFKDKGEDK